MSRRTASTKPGGRPSWAPGRGWPTCARRASRRVHSSRRPFNEKKASSAAHRLGKHCVREGAPPRAHGTRRVHSGGPSPSPLSPRPLHGHGWPDGFCTLLSLGLATRGAPGHLPAVEPLLGCTAVADGPGPRGAAGGHPGLAGPAAPSMQVTDCLRPRWAGDQQSCFARNRCKGNETSGK